MCRRYTVITASEHLWILKANPWIKLCLSFIKWLFWGLISVGAESYLQGLSDLQLEMGSFLFLAFSLYSINIPKVQTISLCILTPQIWQDYPPSPMLSWIFLFIYLFGVWGGCMQFMFHFQRLTSSIFNALTPGLVWRVKVQRLASWWVIASQWAQQQQQEQYYIRPCLESWVTGFWHSC